MTEQRASQPHPVEMEQRGVVDQVAQAVGDTVAGLPKEVLGDLTTVAILGGAKKVYDSFKGKASTDDSTP